MAEDNKPPFRANHVGSLLRLPELRQATFKLIVGNQMAAISI